MKRFWAILIAVGISGSSQAAELARLANGFEIRHERREVVGNVTRLFLNGSSYIDVASSQIEAFEPDLSIAEKPKSGIRNPELDVQQVVRDTATRHRIDPDFISSVIQAESGFNTHAVSKKGARGLMQLMPQTAAGLGVQDSFDPAANVDGGTRYLLDLFSRYNNDPAKALAAYNAGPNRVEQFKGVPPYRETRAYVTRIIKDYNRKKRAQRTNQAASQKAQTVAKNETLAPQAAK